MKRKFKVVVKWYTATGSNSVAHRKHKKVVYETTDIKDAQKYARENIPRGVKYGIE